MNIISVDPLLKLDIRSSQVAFSSSFIFIENSLYKVQNPLEKVFSFDFLIQSCMLEGGYLAFSTSDSIYLFDLMTHKSCHDPSHHHLESQIILYRGISPGLVLALGRFVVVYIEFQVVFYSLEGQLLGSFESEQPLEAQVFGGYLVFRFESKIRIADVDHLKDHYFLDVSAKALGQGDKILLLLSGKVIDLHNNVILSPIHDQVFKVYSMNDHLFCAMPLAVLLYKESNHVHTISVQEKIHKYFFSNDFLVAIGRNSLEIMKIHTFDRKPENQVSDPEEESYSDDFSYSEEKETSVQEDFEKAQEEVKIEDVEASLSQVVLVKPSEALNVVMDFEPASALLNNFSKPDKKNLKKGKKAIINQPVTFHKKIKSSGYGSQPKPAKKGKNLLAKAQSYSTPGVPPETPKEDQYKDVQIHNGAIFCITYDRTGSKLATCGGDSAAYILKLPYSKYKGERLALVGHEWQVNSVTWNSSCSQLLSTSNKYCSKLWNLSGAKAGECLLSINGSYSDGKFYFVDKFISLVSGNEICFFRYKLRDPFCKDDVKRLQAKCQFKQVLRLKQENAQSITRTACHNGFYSHLILAAGSNKVVSVWDVDKQAEVCTIPTVHRKMIHTLRFFSCSDYSEASSDSFNLFLTCSSDNFVRLFDLRVAAEPVVFMGHTNTALELGASISPCRSYVASGSEDRSAYIWDLRTCKVVSRLKGFRDVTNDVAWNPLFQQVCVAGNDGRLKFFS